MGQGDDEALAARFRRVEVLETLGDDEATIDRGWREAG